MNVKIHFSKATKEMARLRMGIAGPAGSGKTWTALEVARHLPMVRSQAAPLGGA